MNKPLITAKAHPDSEAYMLARAMAKARASMVSFYDKHELHDVGKSLSKVRQHEQDEGYAESLAAADPERLSWFGINQLTACGRGEIAQQLWQTCKDEALDEFDSGFRAAHTIDPYSTPAQRARFLVIRDALRDEWKPRGASELLLVDQIAQQHYMYEKWLTTHIRRIEMECYRDNTEEAREQNKWLRPRQDEVEATREAADMAESFQKGFLRTLRALRDLRRYVPPVVIQNAAQVNVANQQVNLASKS